MSPCPEHLFERVAELTDLYLDDEIRDDQLAELDALVRSDPHAVKAMQTVLRQAGMMRVVFSEQRQFVKRIGEVNRDEYLKLLQTLGPAEEPEPVQLVASIITPRPWWQQWPVLMSGSIAAILVIVLSLTIALSDSTPPATNNPSASIPPPRGLDLARAPIVATLTAEHDAQWAEGASAPGSPLPTGTALHAGQRLTLIQGFAEITTKRGAVAIIQAPTTVEFTSHDNAIRLQSGKLVGICETDASKGFLVHTPHLHITDLGTRFGVKANIYTSEIHVFEGEVQAQKVDPATDTQPILLTAHQSAHAATYIKAIKRIEHAEQAFVSLQPMTIRLTGTGQNRTAGQPDTNWHIVAVNAAPLEKPLPVFAAGEPYYYDQHPADPAQSQFITWLNDQPTASGELTYTFRTHISLPESMEPGKASLNLRYMMDNQLVAVVVNGQRIEIDQPYVDSYAQWDRLLIAEHLVPGENIIEFDIRNYHSEDREFSEVGMRLEWDALIEPVFSPMTKPLNTHAPEKTWAPLTTLF